jgi:hypothetical protein
MTGTHDVACTLAWRPSYRRGIGPTVASGRRKAALRASNRLSTATSQNIRGHVCFNDVQQDGRVAAAIPAGWRDDGADDDPD